MPDTTRRPYSALYSLLSRCRALRQRLSVWHVAILVGCIAHTVRKWHQKNCKKISLVQIPSKTTTSTLEPATPGRLSAPQTQPNKFGLQDDMFELGLRLGSGSQGVVHSCKRIRSGHEYAAKVINVSHLGQSRNKEKQTALLRREIRIMQELHHPRIVNLHDAFWEGSFCIIVMDLACGGNLFQKLVAELDAAGNGIFRGLGGVELCSQHATHQLLTGLSYMHAHHVIHRDLKLENVLILNSYRALAPLSHELLNIKIADFGLSKIFRNSKRGKLVSSMTACGSPDYVAPEVLDESYDARADLWSLGVIVYIMLCGEMPFRIKSMNPEKHKKAVADIIRGDSWDLVSDGGKAIVTGMLRVDPEQRLSLADCLRHQWLANQIPEDGNSLGQEQELERTASLLSCRTSRFESGSTMGEEGLEELYGVVSRISCRVDLTVKRMVMHIRDGSVQTAGYGGAREGSWELAQDELLTALALDPCGGDIGCSLVFFTSACRVIALEGSEARTRHRFIAPSGRQVIGLQFENTRLTGILLEVVANGSGSVQYIGGRNGSVVDQITMKLRDGTEFSYGSGTGGDEVEPHVLEPNETIVAVEQYFKERGLGVSVVFYTSAGRVLRVIGMTATRSRRFAVPLGYQICGLEFDGDHLSNIVTCPANGDFSKKQVRQLV